MCLQWCHVRSLIIHNDHPCLHCLGVIRFARQGEDCSACAHYGGQLCNLTKSAIPAARTCCHHNVNPLQIEVLDLTEENILPMQLILYQVNNLKELFWLVESAPEPIELPNGALQVRMEDLAVPMVYGLPANEWEGV